MPVLFAWFFGIGFAVWVCRLLWRARRDPQLKKALAAGVAAQMVGDSVDAAIGDAFADGDSGDAGGDSD